MHTCMRAPVPSCRLKVDACRLQKHMPAVYGACSWEDFGLAGVGPRAEEGPGPRLGGGEEEVGHSNSRERQGERQILPKYRGAPNKPWARREQLSKGAGGGPPLPTNDEAIVAAAVETPPCTAPLVDDPSPSETLAGTA
jgi:hypothetical protein